MDHDLVLGRLLEIEDGRELGGVDDDGLGGILRLLARLGDDDRDRVAAEADLVLRERPVGRAP